MTPDHAELRRLAEAATPGPWEVISERVNSDAAADHGIAAASSDPLFYVGDYQEAENDAAFIAAARTAVPQLLDENERLKGERKAGMMRAAELSREALKHADLPNVADALFAFIQAEANGEKE